MSSVRQGLPCLRASSMNPCGVLRPYPWAAGSPATSVDRHTPSLLCRVVPFRDARACIRGRVAGSLKVLTPSRGVSHLWIGIGDDCQRAFFDRLRTTRPLGRLNDTKVAVAAANSPSAYWRWPVFTLNLLGDPELRVRRQARRTLTFDITDGLSRLRVTELDSLTPVSRATVRVSAGRSVTELVTDTDGWVSLPAKDLAKRMARDGVSIAVRHEDYQPTRSEVVAAPAE